MVHKKLVSDTVWNFLVGYIDTWTGYSLVRLFCCMTTCPLFCVVYAVIACFALKCVFVLAVLSHCFFVQFFEVLAKITLYQKAATTYHLQNDPAVKHWLINLQTYSDQERYAGSVCSNLYKTYMYYCSSINVRVANIIYRFQSLNPNKKMMAVS